MSVSYLSRLLYIDPDEEQALQFQEKMDRAGYEVDLAYSGEVGISKCNEKAYDVVVVEYKIPGMDGLEIIRRLSLHGPVPGTVMLTASGDEVVAAEAMKLGASDYLIKDKDGRYFELFHSVIHRLHQQRLHFEADRVTELNKQTIISGLRAVVTVADELIACPDMDSLFHRTIELLRDVLDLERCSLFVADDAGRNVHGTYGINRHGEIVDERGFSTPMSDHWRKRLQQSRQEGESQWTVLHRSYEEWDGEVYREFGEGWVVATPIHSASGQAGVLINDAALSGSPLDDTKQELIVVFCSVLGNIIERKQAEAALQRANDVLEQRVQERTKVLVELNRERQILSRRLMEVQETERRSLARELHDEIGQALTAVKMNMQAMERIVEPSPQLEDSMSIVETALQQVRNMSLDLRPSMLDDLGLIPALRWYLDRQTQRAGLTAHFSSPDEITVPLPAELESTCFRVAQEAITNIIRHAEAQHVYLELLENDGEIVLVVRDDGVGFDVNHAKRRAAGGASLGVLGMEERVHLVNGDFSIESIPPLGTEVKATIPIPELNEHVELEERTGGG
ncbi:MAG: response regulator [Candidatus Latescibacteria bacterium]|jgi:signal transduction histidine kinase/ActR/RegA family two-component response regulator|nr:response regulator [Candidatus Latescibacterota bacterium]